MRFASWKTRPRAVAIGGAAALVTAGMALLTVGGASGASTTIETAGTTIKTFSTPGTYRWTVPTGVPRVTFDVFGASGGNVVSRLSVVAMGGTCGEARRRRRLVRGCRGR